MLRGFAGWVGALLVLITVNVGAQTALLVEADATAQKAYRKGAPGEENAVLVALDEKSFAGLMGDGGGLVTKVPLPGGKSADLELIILPQTGAPPRIEIVTDQGSKLVDAEPMEELAGEVAGIDGSTVHLVRVGKQLFGTIFADGVTYAISPASPKETTLCQITTNAPPDAEPFQCLNETLGDTLTLGKWTEDPEIAKDTALYEGMGTMQKLATPTDREVTLAIEATFEYSQTFPSEAAGVAYIQSLLSEVAYIYRRDFRTVLRTVSIRIWATSNDPYRGGNDASGNLDDIGVVMNNPATPSVIRNAGLAHLLHPSSSSGGVAWLNAICRSPNFRTGYSGIHAAYVFPNTAYNWDLLVVSHEIGHNFGSPHTHCYTPTIDTCYASQVGCYSGPVTAQAGSIMSYCHLVYRVEPFFHPRTITVVRSFLGSTTCTFAPQVDAFEPDNDATFASRITIHHDQTRSIYPAGDEDWATFTLTKTSGVVIETRGPAGDTELWLYNSQLGQIAYDDNGGDDGFSRIDIACGDEALTAGTYYIRVRQKDNTATIPEYTLRLVNRACDGTDADAYEPDNEMAEATPLTAGVQQTHNINPVGDTDWFRFTLTEPSSVIVNIDSGENFGDRAHHATLYTGDRTILGSSLGTRLSSFSRPCGPTLLLPGDYYVWVSPSNSSQTISSYSINVLVSPCCGVSTAVGPLKIDSTGGGGSFPVTTIDDCQWTASTSDSWIHIQGNPTVTGNANVQYTIDPFAGEQRFGTITVSALGGNVATTRIEQLRDCNGNGIMDRLDVAKPALSAASENCGNALPVVPGVVYTGTTIGRTLDGSTGCGAGTAPDAWYVYRPIVAGEATFSLCGSDYDSVISIHSGCPGTSQNTILCNDDACETQSQLTIPVEPDQDYYIRIAGWNTSVGNFQLVVSGPYTAHGGSNDVGNNGVPDECEGGPTPTPSPTPSPSPTSSPTPSLSPTASLSPTPSPVPVDATEMIDTLLRFRPGPNAARLKLGDRDSNGFWDAADLWRIQAGVLPGEEGSR